MLGSQFIGGWILKPVKDEAGTVTGTNMLFCNSVSVNGNVPAFITNSQLPQAVVDSIKGTTAWVKAKKA